MQPDDKFDRRDFLAYGLAISSVPAVAHLFPATSGEAELTTTPDAKDIAPVPTGPECLAKSMRMTREQVAAVVLT